MMWHQECAKLLPRQLLTLVISAYMHHHFWMPSTYKYLIQGQKGTPQIARHVEPTWGQRSLLSENIYKHQYEGYKDTQTVPVNTFTANPSPWSHHPRIYNIVRTHCRSSPMVEKYPSIMLLIDNDREGASHSCYLKNVRIPALSLWICLTQDCKLASIS